MSTLIACLSTGKGTWGHVSRLIQDGKFDNTILITNDYGKENFQKLENTELIAIKLEQGMKELIEWSKTQKSVDHADKALDELKKKGLLK